MPRKRRSYTYNEYKKAMDMYRRGFGPTEISRELDINRGTIKAWKHGKHIPPLARWIAKSSSELAYIIGVLNGDGYLYINGRHYNIELGVNDYEFVEIFSKNMAKVLNKKVVKPYWDKSNSIWRVIYTSKAFYIWYKGQTLKTLKQYIEYDKDTVASFLRGLYDSDGNHYVYKERYSHIVLYNNDTKLLKYVQHSLKKYFSIITTGPYLHIKAGTKSKMKNGKTAKRNYNNYSIYISRKQYTEKFLSEIRFSISEKQLGLPRRK